MQKATLELSRTVKLEGIKPVWRIHKPSDMATVGDDTFLRISFQQYTLNSLLAYKNDDLPRGLEQQAVVLSRGLKSLIAQRNEKQSDEFKQDKTHARASLFKTPPKQTKLVRTHAEKADMRRNPGVMTIEVVVHDTTVHIDVMRPMHPNDNLFVVYEPEAMAAAIHIMRTMGFDEPQKRDRLPDLPKGVHHRNGFVVAKFSKSPDGLNGYGYKKCKTVEDAVRFLTQPPDDGPHDAADEPPDAAGELPDSDTEHPKSDAEPCHAERPEQSHD